MTENEKLMTLLLRPDAPLALVVYQGSLQGRETPEPCTEINTEGAVSRERRMGLHNHVPVAVVEFPENMQKTLKGLLQLDRGADPTFLRQSLDQLMQFAYQQGRKHVLEGTTK